MPGADRDAVSGDAVSGDAVFGDTGSGDAASGDAASGDPDGGRSRASRALRALSPAVRMRIAVVVLVAASGAMETVSLAALGHVFAGVMTGNLALLGMSFGRGGGAQGRAAALALVGFGAGTAVVAWVTRVRSDDRMVGPRRGGVDSSVPQAAGPSAPKPPQPTTPLPPRPSAPLPPLPDAQQPPRSDAPQPPRSSTPQPPLPNAPQPPRSSTPPRRPPAPSTPPAPQLPSAPTTPPAPQLPSAPTTPPAPPARAPAPPAGSSVPPPQPPITPAPEETHWPHRVLICLLAETALLAVGALYWLAIDGRPDATTRAVLQVGAAATMGAQSAAMLAAGRLAAPTTYLTGMLATYIVRGVGAPRSADAWVPIRLAALVLGAAAAVAVRSAAPGWTVMLPCVLVAGATAALAKRPWRRREQRQSRSVMSPEE